MSLQNVLMSQQSINPMTGVMNPILENALRESETNKQVQYQAAMQQIATQPAMSQQVTDTMRPEEGAALASLANNPSPNGLRNLGFSQLNALANTTPQARFVPTTVPGGAISQGITNAINMGEMRQTRGMMQDMMRQQAAAQQQAAQAQQESAQQAAQAKNKALVVGLRNMNFNDAQIGGIIASGQAAQVFKHAGLVGEQGFRGVAAGQQRDQLIGVNPQLGQAGQPIPLSPADQAAAGVVVGGDFNQYQPQVNMSDAAIKQADANIKAGQAPYAGQQEAIKVQQAQENVQQTRLGNYAKNVENQFLAANEKIDLLEKQGKVEEANERRGQLSEAQGLFNEAMGNLVNLSQDERNRVNAQLQALGFPTKLPETVIPDTIKVKKGKNKEELFYETPQGLVPAYRDGKAQPLSIGQPQPVAAEVSVEPVSTQTQSQQPIVVTQPKQPNPITVAEEKVRQAKPNTAEQKKALQELKALREVEAKQKEIQRFRQNSVRVSPNALNQQPLVIGDQVFDPLQQGIILPQGF